MFGDFNMWDYEMGESEIDVITCDSKGNICSSETLRYNGNIHSTYMTSPNCYF